MGLIGSLNDFRFTRLLHDAKTFLQSAKFAEISFSFKTSPTELSNDFETVATIE